MENQTNQIKKIPLTCIICPMGCSMEVEIEESPDGQKKVLSVKDNGCKRGEQYASKELQNPTRTLTSTIKVDGGVLPVVPVKTYSCPTNKFVCTIFPGFSWWLRW